MATLSRKRRAVSDDEESEPDHSSKKTKTKQSRAATNITTASGKIPGGGATDGEGNEFWELSGSTRRVTVSSFKGTRMVSIREYYEKNGESLPGKKGISMPIAQFSSLVALLPHIEMVLGQKGDRLPRPDYEGAGAPGAGEEDNDNDDDDDRENVNEEDEDEEEEMVTRKKTNNKKKNNSSSSKQKPKRNIDETSDEE